MKRIKLNAVYFSKTTKGNIMLTFIQPTTEKSFNLFTDTEGVRGIFNSMGIKITKKNVFKFDTHNAIVF